MRNLDEDYRKVTYSLLETSIWIRCYPVFFPFKNPLIHPSIILQREMLSKYGLMYSEEFHHAEDLELWSRCARYFLLSNIEEVLVYYRIHNQSIGKLKRNIQKDSANRVHKRELIRSGLLPVTDCQEVLNWINNPLREAKKQNRLNIIEYWLHKITRYKFQGASISGTGLLESIRLDMVPGMYCQSKFRHLDLAKIPKIFAK